MNALIVQFFKRIIEQHCIKYTYLSEQTGMEYWHLIHIFNQNAILSGSELLCISKALGVKQSELMSLLEDTA